MGVLKCPLCFYQVAGDSQEFLFAEHLMNNHMRKELNRFELKCFCGQVMTENIIVVMAHFKHYGGVQEHYRAWQLGVDP